MTASNKTRILPPSNKKRNLFYAVFIGINLFLSCYYIDIWLTPNAASRALPVLTIYEDKTLVIDKYKDYTPDVSLVNNHYYSNKAPLSTFIVYPFYWVYRSLGLPEIKETTLKKYPIYIYEANQPHFDGRDQYLPRTYNILMLGDILCGVLPFVCILVLSLFAIKKTSAKVSPVVAVMLAFYGSFLFAYAGTYNSHVLCGLLTLAAYILIKSKKIYTISGLFVGLAMALEFPVGILLPLWAVLIYLNEKKTSKAALFALGAIPGLLIVLYFNYHLTGAISKTSYNYELFNKKQDAQGIGFVFPKFSAFWGLVFSTYRGVLYYTPVLILMLWYAIKYGYQNIFKKVKNKMTLVNTGIKNYLLVTVVVYLIVYSAYYQWAGGWAFGPRYLIPIVIIVLYEGILFLLSGTVSAYIFYVFTGIGLLFTWMDKSTKIYQFPPNSTNSGNAVFDVVIPDFFKNKFNANTLPVLLFDGNPALAVYIWPLLFVGSMIVLARWYSKLYPAWKNKMNVYIPLGSFLIVYILLLVPWNNSWKNEFSMDYSGPFGGYEHNMRGNTNLDSALTTKDPNKKAEYYKLAISEYQKGIQVSPVYYANYTNLGMCYKNTGDPDDAIPAFQKALQANPKSSIVANSLGVIYFHKSKNDSAVKYFRMAYAADSTNLEALQNVGACYEAEGNYPLAFHYDSLVLKVSPKNKEALTYLSHMHNDIGIQYLNSNIIDKALKEFSLSLYCDSNSVIALGNIGVVYEKMSDIERAKNCFRQALAKDPNNQLFARDLQFLNTKQ